jgi:uncharacterized protein (DUF362 family)
VIKEKNQGISVVAVIKSSTAEYNKVDFRSLLEQAAEELEKNGVALPKSGTVFIKPNMVTPDTSVQSITTDPHFISELIGLLRENGVTKVYVGDSAAGFSKSEVCFTATGMGGAVKNADGILVDIDDPSERVSISLPHSDILKSISVPRKAYEADNIINFGKLKTHRIGAFTCAVKNYVGFIDQITRLANHQSRLPKLVSELHQVMPESICFGDGIIVGEGDGPDLCTPRFLGALVASNDPVALDVIGAKLLGIDSSELLFTLTAYSDGIGEIDISKIRLLGIMPEDMAIKTKRPNEVIYNCFPCNIVLGGMCGGCFAWFQGPALFWQRDGIWQQITKNVGKPKFMMGFNAVDINFSKHLDEGPYFVIGDCTPQIFQQDPRTIFIPGCCPGPAIPEMILKKCKVTKDIE